MIPKLLKQILKKKSEKDMVEQKRNTEKKLQTIRKLDALTKLYEIAGDEWMKNNMK